MLTCTNLVVKTTNATQLLGLAHHGNWAIKTFRIIFCHKHLCTVNCETKGILNQSLMWDIDSTQVLLTTTKLLV
jgi:hypothetical protein